MTADLNQFFEDAQKVFKRKVAPRTQCATCGRALKKNHDAQRVIYCSKACRHGRHNARKLAEILEEE